MANRENEIREVLNQVFCLPSTSSDNEHQGERVVPETVATECLEFIFMKMILENNSFHAGMQKERIELALKIIKLIPVEHVISSRKIETGIAFVERILDDPTTCNGMASSAGALLLCIMKRCTDTVRLNASRAIESITAKMEGATHPTATLFTFASCQLCFLKTPKLHPEKAREFFRRIVQIMLKYTNGEINVADEVMRKLFSMLKKIGPLHGIDAVNVNKLMDLADVLMDRPELIPLRKFAMEALISAIISCVEKNTHEKTAMLLEWLQPPENVNIWRIFQCPTAFVNAFTGLKILFEMTQAEDTKIILDSSNENMAKGIHLFGIHRYREAMMLPVLLESQGTRELDRFFHYNTL